MDQQPAFPRMTKEQVIGKRRERPPQTADREIAGREIAECRDAGSLGDDGGHAEPQLAGKARIAIAADGQALPADAANLHEWDAGLGSDGARGGGGGFADET